MTVPVLTYAQLRDDYLIPNGYSVETPQPQDFWSEHDRVIVKKGDYSFPLQFRERYFYLQVVVLFKQLGIPIPEDHQKCYDQHMAHRAEKMAEIRAAEEARKNNESGK